MILLQKKSRERSVCNCVQNDNKSYIKLAESLEKQLRLKYQSYHASIDMIPVLTRVSIVSIIRFMRPALMSLWLPESVLLAWWNTWILIGLVDPPLIRRFTDISSWLSVKIQIGMQEQQQHRPTQLPEMCVCPFKTLSSRSLTSKKKKKNSWILKSALLWWAYKPSSLCHGGVVTSVWIHIILFQTATVKSLLWFLWNIWFWRLGQSKLLLSFRYLKSVTS